MKKIAIVLTIVLLFSCNLKRTPTATPKETFRQPIATLYVAVPDMKVFAEPRDDAEVISTYGYTESASVLAQKGGWSEVRTFDGGSGWAHTMDLLTAEQLDPFTKDPQPRFYLPPQQVPNARVHGEIVLKASVDTTGSVWNVEVLRNTTRLDELALTNGDALRKAKFYPLINNHQRASFTYEYHVAY